MRVRRTRMKVLTFDLMISVEEALQMVLGNVRDFGTVTVPIEKAEGRVIKQDVAADRDFPPFDRVMMDGIAIGFANYEKGQRVFSVEGIQYAGRERLSLKDQNNCLEVSTGSMLPGHTDTVVPYEDIVIENGEATITVNQVARGQHIHAQGSDRKQGDVLIPSGTFLRPPEIAILSTVGVESIVVSKLPKIAIIYTGDELVSINETPLPHQIRASNNYAIRAALAKRGIKSDWFHLNDDKPVLTKAVGDILKSHDVIILSGGVSKGKKDLVPEVLEEQGVTKLFHRVAQRPGKPFWFGQNDDAVVFALPGNPVSVFMCFCKYVLPWVEQSVGYSSPVEYAKLKDGFKFSPNLAYFLQVKLEMDETAALWGVPLPGQGSGDFANLIETTAFLELPNEQETFREGEVFPVVRFA